LPFSLPQRRLLGLALGGGHSSRMGRDKAAVVLGGLTFAERAVRTLGRVCGSGNVCVSLRPGQHVSACLPSEATRAAVTVVYDAHDDIGPAAGLLAAHAHDPTGDYCAFVILFD
jgi:molybdopterin-guanine dinucleotide biosynthesis protein A